MTPHELAQTLCAVLAEHKAQDPVLLDVTGLTSMTDYMLVAGGGTARHIRALAGHVLDAARGAGVVPLGTEGLDAGDWVLVDLTDVVVHLMTAQARAFYRLEDIWGVQARHEGAAGGS